MRTPRNILVPVDFSATSARSLTYASAFAERFDARLHPLHVIQDPFSQALALEASGADFVRVLNGWEADARRRLEEMKLNVSSTALVTKIGKPFREILCYAKKHDIDLIVMGTHGRGAIAHMLLGSIAEKVVRKASCPVLVVGLR